MSDLQRIADEWHTEWAKAFITQVSAEGEYYIKAKFKTMAEMHTAYDAMAKLADASAPLSTPQPGGRYKTEASASSAPQRRHPLGPTPSRL